MMSLYPAIAVVSFIVSFIVGICGVGGFLLPIFFLGYCRFAPGDALFLTYTAFLLGGLIAVRTYHQRGEMPLSIGLPLGLSSLAGSIAGSLIGRVYVSSHITTVLYTVVLISGIMIFLQRLLTGRAAGQTQTADNASSSGNADGAKKRALPLKVLIPLGFLTALICSMSGAGGPVIVMPLLVVLGLPVRTAIGTAIFDSLFVALPAILIYSGQADIAGMLGPLVITVVTQAAGILTGSLLAGRIPQNTLKTGVGIFAIVFSLWKLFG